MVAHQQNSIQEAIAGFDKSSFGDRKAAAELERKEIINRFPIKSWPSMPVEKYALGQSESEDSFCRWMEFRSTAIAGMKGGSSRKHILYKHKNKSGWFFNKAYKSLDSAWAALRAGFVDAIEFARTGQWEQIDGIAALYGGPALRMKTMYVYFPTEVLPICSIAHIKHFLKRLDPTFNDNTSDVVRLNRLLLSKLREISQLNGWTTWELSCFLYTWADPRDAKRIYKIAPGEKAKYWDDCLKNGYVCVGWDAVGDLAELETKEDLRAKFEEKFDYVPTKAGVKVNELWTLRELEPGDIIVANKGTSHVLAIGEVEEPVYEFRPERTDFKHTVRVKWDTSFATDVPPQKSWAFTTVSKVSAALYDSIIKGKRNLPPVSDPKFVEIAEALERTKQIVLYGPPGTGKTYHARRMSVWWLLRDKGMSEGDIAAVLDSPKEFIETENSLAIAQVNRRAWYVVANPKEWSWQQLKAEKKVEYRYGRIQRNYPLAHPGDWIVGYQAGPQKKVVALARVSRGLSPHGQGDPTIELEYVQDIDKGITYEEMQADTILSNSEPIRFRNQGTLFALTEIETDRMFGLLMERDAGIQQHVESDEVVGQLSRLTFHPSYSYEDFIEGFRPVKNPTGAGLQLRLEDGVFKRVCWQARLQPKKKFIILIDEINRANVSKVLGELITLIEKDKRGLAVTLSQSKESFIVPPNVFIIGTMNTADRSIRLLDVALRRRFAFMEMMPEPELFQGIRIGQLALDEFLNQLNTRISAKFGREKQIGHSFFMSDSEPISDPDTFTSKFRQEVLPLLQEYCFDDYDALAALVGNNLVDVAGQCIVADRLKDPETLIADLIEEYGPASEVEQE